MNGTDALLRSRLTVGAVQTRVLSAGPADASEAVVFLHGNPGSADDWAGLVALAGARARAVAFDLPDFGETAAGPGFSPSLDGYRAFVGEALAALGIARVHLVLHDFGGPIGLAWAAGNGGALASITLIDTGVLPGYRWHTLARVWRTPLLGELLQASTTRAAFRMVVARGEPRGLPRPFLDQMYDHFDRRTRRAVLALYRSVDDPSAQSAVVTAQLAPLDLPALVIWGEHDAYLPAAYAARQRDAFPSADVHVLPASGHWPYVDARETVERLVAGFLDRVAA